MTSLDYHVNLRRYVESVFDGAYGPLDSDGLPLTNYGGSIGLKHNPTTIALFALGNYQYYIDDPKRNEKNLALFSSSVRWLSNNCFKKNRRVYWYFLFDWPTEGLKSPWHSGLTQGLCISVLVRAYLETGNSSFADLAEGGFEVLNSEINDDGALFHEGSDFWMEEYPTNQPNHVLNGFVYAIFGLFDLRYITQSHDAEKSLANSIKTLENNLKSYDLGFWSSYDLKRMCPASLAYHKLHIDQLKSLHSLTGKAIFLKYSCRWENYLNNPMFLLKSQMMYYGKSIVRFGKTRGFRKGLEEGTIALLQNLRKKR